MTNQLREVVADALPELLPCPFCGATRPGIALHSTLADRCFRVLCICGAEGGPWGKRDDEEWGTYEEAIAAWNRRATLQTQSAGVEERALAILAATLGRTKEQMGEAEPDAFVTEVEAVRAIAAALRTPASEGDGGRVVEWQIMRPAFVTADENYSGKRVAAVYADASMIGQRVRLIFDTTPPTQQEARAVDDEMVERAARIVAELAGEDFDLIGGFAQGILLDTQRAALTAALQPGSPT